MSIAELCEWLAARVGLPKEEVQLYARRLLDAGRLQKSRGRWVYQADTKDFVLLVIALAGAARSTEANLTVETHAFGVKKGSEGWGPSLVERLAEPETRARVASVALNRTTGETTIYFRDGTTEIFRIDADRAARRTPFQLVASIDGDLFRDLPPAEPKE